MPNPEEFTLKDVAAELGCNRTTVSRIVAKLSLGRTIGNMKLVTADEVEVIRATVNSGPGNPEFGSKYKGLQPSTRIDAKRPGRPKKETPGT